MSNNLYVGNLPWSMTEDELVSAFEAHGRILSARIMTEKETGRSRGFGFVECEDDDADKLVKMMNGTTLGNREINVSIAKPKGEKGEKSA